MLPQSLIYISCFCYLAAPAGSCEETALSFIVPTVSRLTTAPAYSWTVSDSFDLVHWAFFGTTHGEHYDLSENPSLDNAGVTS